jgi:UDP-N-acetylmuramyl tripeptide synthase
MSVRTTLTVTKAATKAARLLGKGSGTALPGLIAQRLQPELPQILASQLPHGIILVTGTNGKTTTTKLILEMLEAHGEVVLSNRAGSNLRRGIISTLINAANMKGEIKATIGLFEVDEASLRLVTQDLKPRAILVLNLFRDQLDRYGELDTLAKVIGEGIADTQADLYLNADDPLVASLANYAKTPDKVAYFGIEGLPASGTSALVTVSDSDRCPLCGSNLKYSRIFYGHIGHYTCSTGDFNRPQPQTAITNAEAATLEKQEFTLSLDGKRTEMTLPLPGTYNLYNALGAAALASGLGLQAATIADSLAHTTAAFGRVEKVKLGTKTLYLLLIKNPAGFTQIVETFLRGNADQNVMMAINDKPADGRDISWLWDVPLEAIAADKPKIITTGIRGADMALRLKYAGIDGVLTASMKRGLQDLIEATPENGVSYILPSYTAMLEIRALLSKMTTLDEVWK